MTITSPFCYAKGNHEGRREALSTLFHNLLYVMSLKQFPEDTMQYHTELLPDGTVRVTEKGYPDPMHNLEP